jgi:hypothetical protein
MRWSSLIIVSMLASSGGSLNAEQKFPPDKFANLQIFPKETTPGVVINAMKGFTRALGVRCQFCHVGEEGLPLESLILLPTPSPRSRPLE